MASIKTLIPLHYKQISKNFLRKVKLILAGKYLTLASKHKPLQNLYLIKTIEQKLNSTPSSAEKIHNLQLALNKLNHLVIEPNELFSFWHLVGHPSSKNGYKKSRAIVGNHLQQSVGGGLCQLSGLVYFLALHSGVQITERYPHSVDIYTNEERFTPLGSDATVVFGYKDLQFKNNLTHPLYLNFTLTEDKLTGSILSSKPLIALNVNFTYQTTSTSTLVTTNITKETRILTSFNTIYKKI